MNSKRNNSVGIQWSDRTFANIYWLPLVRYKRPDTTKLTSAIKYFILHYGNGTGTVEDWQNTLNILLLGLHVTCNNVSYILANEDVHKTEQKELEFSADVSAKLKQADLKINNSTTQFWNEWCLEEFSEGHITELATYFGCISLFLCRLGAQNTDGVGRAFNKITGFMSKHFHMIVNDNRKTPTPNPGLFNILRLIFVRQGVFSKQIVCRLAQRRMEMKSNEDQNAKIYSIQNIACYDALSRSGIGLLHWFLSANKVLKIPAEQFLDMLTCIGEFEKAVHVITEALPKIAKSEESRNTWSICRPYLNSNQ